MALALVALAGGGCRRHGNPPRADPRGAAEDVQVGGLSFSLPSGFVRKAWERTREPLREIPGQSTEQVFASWEGPGGQSFTLFFWSERPPRDLGPMVATQRWPTKIAGRPAEAAETRTFMGREQRVLVAWLELPHGGGRFMMYSRNLSRETFDTILAAISPVPRQGPAR